jgi:uncharacterized protein (DUF486 family)
MKKGLGFNALENARCQKEIQDVISLNLHVCISVTFLACRINSTHFYICSF